LEKDGTVSGMRRIEGFDGCAKVDGWRKSEVSGMDYGWSVLQPSGCE
jgi:hypothetical protein